MIRLEISKSSHGVGLKFQDGKATDSHCRLYLKFQDETTEILKFHSNSLNWIFSSTDEITAALMRARNVVVTGKECQSLQVKAAKLLANTDAIDNDKEELSLEEAWCIILIVGIDVLTVIVLSWSNNFTFRQESQHYW